MIEWGLNRIHGIKNKIIIIAILQLVFFCIMGIISFRVFTAVYETEVYNESANTLKISSTVLDEELKKIEQMSFQISTDPVIQNYMEGINYEYYGYDVYRSRRFLLERLNSYYSQERYVSSIQMLDTLGEYYVVGNQPINDFIDREWTDEMSAASGANVWMSLSDEGVLVSTREMRKLNDLSLSYLGSVFITIDMEEFISDSLNLSSDKSFVIMKDDEVMYVKDFPIEAETLLEGATNTNYQIKEWNDRKYFYTSQHSRHSELMYFNILPFDEVAGSTSRLNQLMIGSFILILFIIILISSKLARTISKPLEDLTQKMKQVEMGNFTPMENEKRVHSSGEIEQLHTNFDSMIQKINTLITENYSKQLVIKETEYRALQAQINPHFLYNTLDSINWLAKVNRQNDISNIAESLGNMMRTIISKKEPLISIQEELNIVHHYMVIQKYRYKKRLTFEMKQPDEVDLYRIPKLTIQPIVENAIQHSLEEIIDECVIQVELTVNDQSIEILISDNGVGMSQETIQAIYEGRVKPKRSGIGLANIMERIQLMFGEPYGLDIQSEVGNGTTVTITLPTVKE
ncbi:sensor histidine kinase [Alkalicoccobacillus porphyridii]|nr:sensor histidine kinase [Alkalicoccobacillus porphyridii]